MKKLISLSVLVVLAMLAQPLGSVAQACDIAVVSREASDNNRPFIWKNRDHDSDWRQELAYKTAGCVNGVGSYIVVVDSTSGTAIPSGGANDVGFAIANTTVYENNTTHENFMNANHLLLEDALKACVTVADFDEMLRAWDDDSNNALKIISGNFVVIDAYGGAALYEGFSGAHGSGKLYICKYDAVTGRVTNKAGAVIGVNGVVEGYVYDYELDYLTPFTLSDYEPEPMTAEQILLKEDLAAWPGFVNRTNSHLWIERKTDDNRQVRGNEILHALKAQKALTYDNAMRYLARDLNRWDYENGVRYFNSQAPLTSAEKTAIQGNTAMTQVRTDYSINRYQTNLSLVVDGVGQDEDPRLTTFWCNLGEPAVGVFLPFFPAAGDVSAYSKSTADSVDLTEASGLDPTVSTKDHSCYMNRAICAKELTLYNNNAYQADLLGVALESVIGGNADTSIDYPGLLRLQQWTLPLETILVNRYEEFTHDLDRDAGRLTAANLNDFAKYAAMFAYANYIKSASDHEQWSWVKPWGGSWVGSRRYVAAADGDDQDGDGEADVETDDNGSSGDSSETAGSSAGGFLDSGSDGGCFISCALR